jgi:hypothetical protein
MGSCISKKERKQEEFSNIKTIKEYDASLYVSVKGEDVDLRQHSVKKERSKLYSLES